jgi:ABC-2 type transport system ATP-binding protein
MSPPDLEALGANYLRERRPAHGRSSLLARHGYPLRGFAYKASSSQRKHVFLRSRMTSSSAPAILADNLSKTYDRVPAVESLSFCVETGSVVGLLGGNGAGKTTTLAMIMGLTTPTAGSVRVFGADMAHDREKVLHRINFESPYADLPQRLTVRQNLSVFGRLYGVPKLKSRIEELAQALDLTQLLDRRVGQLSAGQKTRAALAKALVNEPDLLLLDEPTASLDPDTADWVRGHLEEFRRRRGATILLASHNMGEVERLCDRVIIMRTGRIVHNDPPDALITRYGRETLEEVFLDVARGRGASSRGQKAQATP